MEKYIKKKRENKRFPESRHQFLIFWPPASLLCSRFPCTSQIFLSGLFISPSVSTIQPVAHAENEAPNLALPSPFSHLP